LGLVNWFTGSAILCAENPAVVPGENIKVLRVYIGTYTTGESRGIYTAQVDLDRATLSEPVLAAQLRNPSFLAIHPTKPVLYAVGEMADFQGKRMGAVTALAIERPAGTLRLLNQQPSGGAGPCHLCVDSSGEFVVVANYGAGSTACFPLAPDGSLKPASAIVQHQGFSVHPTRQKGPHAHQVRMPPGKDLVLVPDLGLDKVMLYHLDKEKGELRAANPPSVSLPPGSGPRHLAFGPGGKFLYVLNELSSSISVFACRDWIPLKLVQTVSALPADFPGDNTGAEVVVHPSGRFLYSSNRGHDSIAIFSIDQANGTLTLRGHVPSGGRTPRNFNIDPSGTLLISANQNSNNILVYRIDQTTGELTPSGSEIKVGAPVCIIFAKF